MSEIKVNSIVDASGGNTATINGVAPNAFNIRGKNKIINGNFDVWQRGFGTWTSQSYTADRWLMEQIGTSCTTAGVLFPIGHDDVPDHPRYFIRNTVSSVTGATNRAQLMQNIEFVETLANETVTVTFWAKADGNKQIAVEFLQYFGAGGSPSATVDSIGAQKVSITSSWAKYEVTASIPSVSGKSLGTDGTDFLRLTFHFDAGTDLNSRTDSLGHQSGVFDIAQVQVEKGSVSTAFETLSYGETLAMCQRYYQLNPSLQGAMNNANDGFACQSFGRDMRANPSYSIVAGTGSIFRSGVATYNINSITSSSKGYLTFALSSNFGANIPAQVVNNSLSADAEL